MEFNPPDFESISFRPVERSEDESLLENLVELQGHFPDGKIKRHLFSIPDQKKRTLQWAESRRCVVAVVHSLLRKGVSPSKILVSLSHTRGAAIAIASVQEQDRIGLGVDLENSQRKINAAVQKQFYFPNEAQLGLCPLTVWTIKEACYKANPTNENTLISDYVINQASPDRTPGEAACLKNRFYHFRFRVFEQNGFKISISEALNPKFSKAHYLLCAHQR